MLIDRFGRVHNYLRISVTDRCNFRCGYCMPPEGILWRERDEILTFEEIIKVAKIFARLGVNKIRLTGGEPTVRKNIEQLISDLAAIENIESLLMTTNGSVLARKAAIYRDAGLTGLNVSLDTLRPERFAEITRRNNFATVMDGITASLTAGFKPLKINVVAMAGVNDDEIMDFVHFAKDKPINVRFIEFMPFKNNGWNRGEFISYSAIREIIEREYPLRPIKTDPSAVAKDFAIENFEGTVSFVTSMSESFCSTCNRIRLTADGQIKSCLFSPAESDLRSLLRSGASEEEMEDQIRKALWMKPQEHPLAEELLHSENRAMVEIGG